MEPVCVLRRIEMITPYARNFATGRDDKANGLRCNHPATIPDMSAYRGYMDGWSGREFKQPRAMQPLSERKERLDEILCRYK